MENFLQLGQGFKSLVNLKKLHLDLEYASLGINKESYKYLKYALNSLRNLKVLNLNLANNISEKSENNDKFENLWQGLSQLVNLIDLKL